MDPTGEAGKLINAGIKLIKHGGNPKKAGKEFVADVAEAGAELLDGDLTLDDAEAVFNLLSPVSTKEAKAAAAAARQALTRDGRRVAEQAARRAARRERQSREGPDGARDQAGRPQRQSGEGFRDREQANRGPSGTRPRGPDRSNNRERNRGIDEEHSMKPKGQQGPR